MNHSDVKAPHAIADVAAALLDLEFPADLEQVGRRIGHILLEDRHGVLVSAGEAAGRDHHGPFETADDVVVAVVEGLGTGELETDLAGKDGPVNQGWGRDTPAAAEGNSQLLDSVDRNGGPEGQVLRESADDRREDARDRLRSRQRDTNYEPPQGPAADPALDVRRPALLDPSSNPDPVRPPRGRKN